MLNRLRRILELAAPEWRALVLGTGLLLISTGAGLAYPRAIQVIMDEAIVRGQTDAIDRAAFIMLGLFVVQGLASGLRYYVFTAAGERIVARLRRHLYERIMAQEVGFFDGRRTGELMSRLSADAGVLQNAVSVNISMALRSAAGALGGIGLLFWISAKLTLLMMAVVPPVALAAGLFGQRIQRLSRAAQDALAEASRVAEETIGGIRMVRSFGQEPAEVRRYAEAVDHSYEVSRGRIATVAWFSGGASIVGFGAIAAVLWYGGRLVVSEKMSAGSLTSFILYTLIVAFSLGALASLWSDFMRAVGAAQRVFELIDREASIPLTGGTTLDRVEGKVELKAVSFAYPSRPDVMVLKDIELALAPGEVVALVGPSGGGKSTIAALLNRLYDPGKGEIRLDGHRLPDLDPTWLRRQIGVVAQDPVLLSTTVAENIRYGRSDADDTAVVAAAEAANAHSFIVGFPDRYETLVGERGVQLSGGQRQRVAIARAVLKDPRVLILDEATSALDAESEHLVQAALEKLQRGRTTLVIAHRLSTVRDADRVVVINEGRVEQLGRHEALMAEADGLYRRLVERQYFTQ